MAIYPFDVIKSNIQSSSSSSSSSPSSGNNSCGSGGSSVGGSGSGGGSEQYNGLYSTAVRLKNKYGYRVFTKGLGITVGTIH